MSTTPPAMRLATDIAAQFQHIPDQDAADRVALHIRMFWAPRMHHQLRQQVNDAGANCDPVLRLVASLLDNA